MWKIKKCVKFLDSEMLKFVEACVLRGAAWRL